MAGHLVAGGMDRLDRFRVVLDGEARHEERRPAARTSPAAAGCAARPSAPRSAAPPSGRAAWRPPAGSDRRTRTRHRRRTTARPRTARRSASGTASSVSSSNAPSPLGWTADPGQDDRIRSLSLVILSILYEVSVAARQEVPPGRGAAVDRHHRTGQELGVLGAEEERRPARGHPVAPTRPHGIDFVMRILVDSPETPSGPPTSDEARARRC